MQQPFTVLYAHQVAAAAVPYYPDNFIKITAFRQQLKWLKNRFSIISLSEAVARNTQNAPLNNCLVLTFDDGFRSVYDTIAPILKEEQLSATFFLNPPTLDNQSFMWRTALFFLQKTTKKSILKKILNQPFRPSKNLLSMSNAWHLQQQETLLQQIWNDCGAPPMRTILDEYRPYLTVAQVQELQREGFEIGSHTQTHPFCHRLSSSELQVEIHEAHRQLEQLLEKQLFHFAYPFGTRPAEEKQLFENTTLKTALGISYKKWNNHQPLTWNRVKMENSLLKTQSMIWAYQRFGH